MPNQTIRSRSQRLRTRSAAFVLALAALGVTKLVTLDAPMANQSLLGGLEILDLDVCPVDGNAAC